MKKRVNLLDKHFGENLAQLLVLVFLELKEGQSSYVEV